MYLSHICFLFKLNRSINFRVPKKNTMNLYYDC